MFAYCNNNPVYFKDENGNFVVYVIKYVKTEEDPNKAGTFIVTIKYEIVDVVDGAGLQPPIVVEAEETFYFTIKRDGLVGIDNRSNSALLLSTYAFSNALAQEIYNIHSDRLKGRTIKGIAREIRVHAILFMSTLKEIKAFVSTDIGSLVSGEDNDDYNAEGFENYLYMKEAIIDSILHKYNICD